MELGRHQFLASIHRPVRLRIRPDLIATPRVVAGETRYFIKDPISLAHHQLWEQEFVLLTLLDGKTSMAEMKEKFEARFKPARLDIALLEVLHGQFHRNGLILSDHDGQGEQLFRRHLDELLRQRKRGVFHLLAWRFRGINPDSFLTLCNRWLGFLFTPASLTVLLMFVAFSVMFLIAQWHDVLFRLPNWNALLNPQNLVVMTISFVALKALHELGHGLACKFFGGECNEMGVMLLAFAPCLYCDVSDSWMIANKWQRAMVAAAGVGCEVVIAAGCMWLWWFSQPGLIHDLAFTTMVVGSIGTILFNANPLLRYDGYFVMSDLVEAPNLWFQARLVLVDSVRTFFFTATRSRGGDLPEHNRLWMWCFAVASATYRFLLTVTIVLFVYGVFHSWKLEVVGAAFVLLILLSLAMRPISGLGKFLKDPSQMRSLRKGRALLSCMLLGLVITILWIPMPARVRAPVLIQYANATPIVNVVGGELVHVLPAGTMVQAGMEIAKLDSKSIALDLLARQGELLRYQARLSGLAARRGNDPTVSSLVPAVEESIDGVLLEVKRLRADVDQLSLKSPIDGVILAPQTRLPESNYEGLEYWSGNPLESENLGCLLKPDTVICQVGNKENLLATAYLSQSQVDLIRPDQSSVIRVKQYPGQRLSGSVVNVGSLNDSVAIRDLRRTGVLSNVAGQADGLDASPIYVASISIATGNFVPIHGTPGEASITIAPQSLATRLLRLFHQTFVVDPTVQGK